MTPRARILVIDDEPALLEVIGELLAAWAQLPEVTEDASYWVRKAGPEHLEEHLPRLEAWLDELERR